MTMDNTIMQIDRIFNAKSISIIGASNKEKSFGRMFLEGIIRMGFENIYPVHPRDTEMMGLKSFKSIKDIPVTVDLAILMTPPAETLRIVQDCVGKVSSGIIVFTAGFGEKGEEGKKTQQEIARIARENGIRVIGPNALGFYCPASKLLTFPEALSLGLPKESGKLGVISHSGSFVDYLTCLLSAKSIRFSKAVSCGNECDLNAVDFLEYLGQDSDTRLIVSYLEGIKDGKRFFTLAQRISKQKPIIVWKGGVTESGAKAALAHTGALAGSKQIWEAMFKQSGIVSVTSFEEIVDCSMAFYHSKLPRGRRVAIVSGQGGTGVGTSDNCVRLGLELANLSETTLGKLTQIVPPVGATVGNPTDIGVAVLLNPGLYGEAIKILADDDNVDMLLVITPAIRACTQSILDSTRNINKPLVASIFSLPELAPAEFQFLSENKVPTYADAKRAAFALSKLAEYAEFVSK
jgi:acyl-CoA synthetase (NDP forming)